jgi:hypothetical protein
MKKITQNKAVTSRISGKLNAEEEVSEDSSVSLRTERK